MTALEPEYVIVGRGNVKKLQELPPGCRAGDNANAFLGGFRLWEEEGIAESTPMTAGSPLCPARPTWKALAAHYQQVRVVASFSRALVEGLTAQQSDAEFNALRDARIQSVFEASTT
jgi:hypothetical protein